MSYAVVLNFVRMKVYSILTAQELISLHDTITSSR
jgi:hypothetical protein